MKTKQKKTYRVTYLGCEGVGATRTEAKQNAMKRIQDTFENATSPTILRWRGYIAVFSRYLDNYEYAVISDATTVNICGVLQHGVIMQSGDRIECLERVKCHLAQIGWTPADGKTIPLIMRGCTDDKQSDFLRWARWQLAAYHAKHVLGMTDSNAIHRWACENDSNF